MLSLGLPLSTTTAFAMGLALLLGGCSGAAVPARGARELASWTPEAQALGWGQAVMGLISRELVLPRRGLHAQGGPLDGRRGASSLWPLAVMLSAQNAGARLLPALRPGVRRVVGQLPGYWREDGPVPGYNATRTGRLDRYYDDNAWLVLGLTEAHELLGDPALLALARAALAFVLSGEDPALGGGIYWRERPRDRKNACATAPAAAAAFVLHRLTGEVRYRRAGERLLGWLRRTLVDPADGLLWDHKRLDGTLERAKRAYNTALFIRILLERGDPQDLVEAEALGRAAARRWLPRGGRALRSTAPFAHMLAENLLRLDRRLGRPLFRARVHEALAYLRRQVRDPLGRFPRRWDRPSRGPLVRFRLIDQASAARAFFLFAAGPR